MVLKLAGAFIKVLSILCFAFGTVLALWGVSAFKVDWQRSTYLIFAAGVLYAVGTIFILIAPSPTDSDRLKRI
ncbi:MAG TPA: hypothetical protein ENF73_00715 [Proteobacteria bacterium]|nr:hypothetical protein [Pseudomonadota bacterium]